MALSSRVRLPAVLVLAFSALALLSCGGSGNSSGLSVALTPNNSFFLPGNITISSGSCYEDDTVISEPRYVVNSVTTTWVGDGTFEPVALKLKINEINGIVSEHECVITGRSDSNLGIFLGFGGRTIAQNETKTSTCAVHCGGVGITNDEKSFSVAAEIKLIGIQTKTNGDQKPATVRSTIVLQNLP